MSRRRYVSTVISLDAAINRLALEHSDFAALLYTWMIPHAGDDGMIHGTAEEILYMVMPGRRDKEPGDIEQALTAMQDLGLIEWNPDVPAVGFPLEPFYKYQSYIKGDRRRDSNGDDPDKKGNEEQRNVPTVRAEQRNSTHITAEQRASAQNIASFSSSFNPSVSSSSSSKEIGGGNTNRAREGPADSAAAILDRLGIKENGTSGTAAAVQQILEALNLIPEPDRLLLAGECRNRYEDWDTYSPGKKAGLVTKWVREEAKGPPSERRARASPNGASDLPWLPDDPVEDAHYRQWDEELKVKAKQRASSS